MGVSIYSIGKELGVSPTTVSRALSMHPSISAEVRERVCRVAEKYNFKPRSSRPIAIYAVIEQLRNHPLEFDSFLSKSLEGIAEYCHLKNLAMGIFPSDVDSFNECDIVKELGKRGANAAIVICSTLKSDYLHQLEKQRFPFLRFLEKSDLNARNILAIDNRSLSRQMVEHLIQLGHRKIAIIGDDFQVHPIHQERLLGYKDALAEAGLIFDERLVVSGDDNPEQRPVGSLSSGIDGITRLLNSGCEFTAVFAIGESIAKGILGTLYARGIKVPHQISVAGFDDFPETALLCPALTTVSVPYKKIAYEYSRQLHRLVRGFDVSIDDEDISGLTGTLQIRESTAPPPVVNWAEN